MLDFWFHFKKNRGAVAGLILIGLFLIVAVLGPWLAPHDPTVLFPDMIRKAPIWSADGVAAHFLGTDDVGRDVLSRLIFGARVSLGVGFLVVVISLSLGILIGLISGYFGGWIDRIFLRLIDILMTLPSILLAIVVVSILGPSLVNAILAVSIVEIPKFARLVRASVMTEKNKPYVTAVRSFGAGHFRVLVLNIFPNCLAPLIVQASLGFSDGILNAAALGFLGLGAQPPTPEWGTMLADSRAFIESAPSLVALPGICILLVVLGFNLLGDGLRDAFDPRLKRT
jgi:ABC-type dipeptide/oligopeptide/nickel transport system permease subunit